MNIKELKELIKEQVKEQKEKSILLETPEDKKANHEEE
jgi:dynactin complex subunit